MFPVKDSFLPGCDPLLDPVVEEDEGNCWSKHGCDQGVHQLEIQNLGHQSNESAVKTEFRWSGGAPAVNIGETFGI